MDTLSKEKRSWNMSRIGSRNTKPELIVRSMLHKMGLRFRIHRKDLPGKPDIVLPKYRTAIFVHGCFWHRHKNCKYAYCPKTNVAFWQDKFKANTARDHIICNDLRKMKWHVVVIWECQVMKETQLIKRLQKMFGF